MSRFPGNTNTKRFPARKENGKWHCRICGVELAGRKTSFCGRRCLRDFFMLTDWPRVRKVVFARDGGICMKCGQRVSEKNFHVDHIVPLARGGDEWDLNNLELSCPGCNIAKAAKLEE